MVTAVDDQFVEVGLVGSWVAEDRDAHAGMFLAAMSHPIERCIYKLWQISEARVSSLA
jgi:hypothetical protein